MPQLRQNIITGEWVVIAPERSKRPNDFVVAETIRPVSKIECPFCLDSDNYKHQKVKGFESSHIYILKNRYPAFVETKKECSPRTIHKEDHFYHVKASLGGHDVIIVKDHNMNVFTFTESIWAELFTMFALRYKYWRQDCNTEYAMAVYNQGQRAGASIQHPHAQLFASDIIPNQVIREQRGAETYYEKYTECVFCRLIEHEIEQKIRIIYESKRIVAFTFYAARFPFEIWILPREHQSHYEQTTHEDHLAIAKCLKEIMEKLGKTLQAPPLNFYLHDLPIAISDSEYYHWHIEIATRVSLYGGYELGSGVIIDVMSPEEAAKYLNKE